MSDKFSNGEAFKSLEEAERAINDNRFHDLRLDDSQLQLVLLALAELSILQPGWLFVCEEIAKLMDNLDQYGQAKMFEQFRLNRSNLVAETLRKS